MKDALYVGVFLLHEDDIQSAWAIPLTIGYSLPLDCMYFALLPALRNGFSFFPPPEIIPIIARHFGFIFIMLPDGNFIFTLSTECEKTIAEEPAALISFPPSPIFFSILQISVPSGIDPKSRMFLGDGFAPFPISIFFPTTVPSGAGTYE